MLEVVTIWVPFCKGRFMVGCVNFPAVHISQRTQLAWSMTSWRHSCPNINDPTGCSRWKWKESPRIACSLNNAAHRRRCTSSSSWAWQTLCAASKDLFALNWDHLHQALHLGDVQMCFGELRRTLYNWHRPSYVFKSPCFRPKRNARSPCCWHCDVKRLSAEQ